MILVDTSVLIAYLRQHDTAQTHALETIMRQGLPWGINVYVYHELLQGAKDEREFEQLQRYFSTLPFYDFVAGLHSIESAARLNLRCRQAGFTLRSTIDTYIAQIAIDNQLLLLHSDRDFDRIAQVATELTIYPCGA